MSEEINRRLKPLIRPRDQWTPVDEALYSPEKIYHVEDKQAEKLLFAAIQYSFEHHYKNNAFYQRLCQSENVSPADIQQTADLYKIPLIPDTFFKDYPSIAGFYPWLQKISSVKLPDIKIKKNNDSFDSIIEAMVPHNFTVTFTSGSSGKNSFFPRDELTWRRQKYSIAATVAEVFETEYEDGNPHLVSISAFSHPDKTLLYTGKVTGAAYESMIDPEDQVYLLNRKVTTDSLRIAMGRPKNLKEKIMFKFVKAGRQKMLMDMRKNIEMYASQGRKMVIAAPPFLVGALLEMLEAEGKKLDLGKHAWLFTGGGWKMQSGATIAGDEWRARIKAVLGIPEVNCRDGYGMSECSAYFADCEGHYKHIPHSIVFPILLDDELKPIKSGNTGRLALLDPLTNSFPGFIITGDQVTMLPHCPVCDRPGPVFTQDISRIGGAEGRGCASIAGELMSNEMTRDK